MSDYYPNPSGLNHAIRWRPANLNKGPQRSLGVTQSAPHPQVQASIDENRDGKNLVNKLAPKEMGDILSFSTSIIGNPMDGHPPQY